MWTTHTLTLLALVMGDRGFVATADGGDAVAVSSLSMVLSDPNLGPTRLEAQMIEGAIEVRLSSKEYGNHTVRLRGDDYPNLTLADLRVSRFEKRFRNALVVSAKFGKAVECFENDDGRKLLTIDFAKKGATGEVREITPSCSFSWRPVAELTNLRGTED